jgi:DNA invertase Pin-like site-specific DNA recombinase
MVKSNNKKVLYKSKQSVCKKIDDLCVDFKSKQINNSNAIIYCRVSTQNQTLGSSLETQMEVGTSYCTNNKFKITNIVHEVCSAKDMHKQEKLIELIKSNENINIIIHDPSRISRNIGDFAQLLHICESKKITMHFASDNLITNNSNDIKQILSSVYDSEIEIKTLSKRVKASIERRKRNKTYLPSVPKYGYIYEKKIIDKGVQIPIGTISDKNVTVVKKNEHEQKVINLVNKMYWGDDIKPIQILLEEITGEKQEIINPINPNEQITRIEYGNMTFVDIADFFNAIELTRRSKLWTADAISCIINKKNIMEASTNSTSMNL